MVLEADCPSYSTQGAVGDIFTVLAHSDWCRAGAGQAARHQANWKVPPLPHESNAVVLANTRRRSKIVAGGPLRASGATHDASPANRRVWALWRTQPSVLGEGAGKTRQHDRRENGPPVSAEV